MKNGNEYLNSTNIARILGLTPTTVIAMLNDGRIRSSKISSRSRIIDPEDLIIYLERLGNDRRAMAGFKRDIYKFLYSKYSDLEYLKESNKQAALYEKYSEERFEALKK
ncbi:helix-turn-helix domain-containing protein [Candidatus Atribacteria bacterium 1244-E10-H5-B2]|nr:MAG: helix-turn-helix domain-containing protein [Candidatus Atribacteria bacterium 1244-E10-H5-B2]